MRRIVFVSRQYGGEAGVRGAWGGSLAMRVLKSTSRGGHGRGRTMPLRGSAVAATGGAGLVVLMQPGAARAKARRAHFHSSMAARLLPVSLPRLTRSGNVSCLGDEIIIIFDRAQTAARSRRE